MNKHLTDEQLVMHFYGDDEDRPGVASHLESCAACHESLVALSSLLTTVKDSPAPEPLHGLEARVWAKLQPSIARVPKRRWFFFPVRQWVYAGIATAALAAAFLLGRFSPRESVSPQSVALSPGVRERILLVNVADHLERSQMMLVELLNATDTSQIDLPRERQKAEDLVTDNRLYRQAASRDGDVATADVLEELERIFLEVGNAPDKWSDADLKYVHDLIDREGLIVKVRVLGSEARERGAHNTTDSLVPTI
jgi:hypothetical protein